MGSRSGCIRLPQDAGLVRENRSDGQSLADCSHCLKAPQFGHRGDKLATEDGENLQGGGPGFRVSPTELGKFIKCSQNDHPTPCPGLAMVHELSKAPRYPPMSLRPPIQSMWFTGTPELLHRVLAGARCPCLSPPLCTLLSISSFFPCKTGRQEDPCLHYCQSGKPEGNARF